VPVPDVAASEFAPTPFTEELVEVAALPVTTLLPLEPNDRTFVRRIGLPEAFAPVPMPVGVWSVLFGPLVTLFDESTPVRIPALTPLLCVSPVGAAFELVPLFVAVLPLVLVEVPALPVTTLLPLEPNDRIFVRRIGLPEAFAPVPVGVGVE